MRAISLNLRNFIKEVYGYDTEEILNGDFFNIDTSWVEVKEEDMVKAKEYIDGYKGIPESIKNKVTDLETLKEAVLSAKAQNYESIYNMYLFLNLAFRLLCNKNVRNIIFLLHLSYFYYILVYGVLLRRISIIGAETWYDLKYKIKKGLFLNE